MATTHAGSIIEKAVRRRNVSISSLSRKMNVNRRTLYNWFNKETLPSKIIGQIGKTIKYDFSSDFSNTSAYPDLKFIESDPSTISKSEISESQAYQYWMIKYIELLEKYNVLLVKKI